MLFLLIHKRFCNDVQKFYVLKILYLKAFFKKLSIKKNTNRLKIIKIDKKYFRETEVDNLIGF